MRVMSFWLRGVELVVGLEGPGGVFFWMEGAPSMLSMVSLRVYSVRFVAVGSSWDWCASEQGLWEPRKAFYIERWLER